MPSRRSTLAAVAGAASLTLAGCTTSRESGATLDDATDWPLPFHDTANTRAVDGPGPVEEPEVAWRAETATGRWPFDYSYTPSPVVADGTVYTGGQGLNLISANDGTVRTRFSEEYVFGPAVRDGSLFVASRPAAETLVVRRLSPDGRSTEWERRLGRDHPRARPLTVTADTVYVPVGTGTPEKAAPDSHELLALNAGDGGTRWSVTPTERRYTPLPAVRDDTLYLSTGGRESRFQAFGPDCGPLCRLGLGSPETRWTAAEPTPTGSVHPPVVADGRVFLASQRSLGSGPGVLRAYDAGTGAVDWERTYGDTRRWTAAPATDGEALYTAVGGGTTETVALALSTDGEERWRVPLGVGEPTTPPVLAGSTLFVGLRATGGASTPRIYAVDTASGHRRWQRPLPVTPAALAVVGETLYASDWVGPVLALR